MPVRPHHARYALAGIVVVSAAIAGNVLFLQDVPADRLSGRSKALVERAEMERSRQLALASDPASAHPDATRSAPAAAPQIVSTKGQAVFDPMAPHIQRALLTDDVPQTPAPPQTARTERQPAGSELLRHLQRELDARGYAPGSVEGGVSLAMRGAIMAYEHDEGLPLTAEATVELLLHLRNGPQAFRSVPVGKTMSTNAETLVRDVQQALQSQGGFKGRADGRMSPETSQAIRDFERTARLVPTGRISAPLLVKLAPSFPSRGPMAALKAGR